MSLAIKKEQEETLARVPLDTLFIVLWIRNDPPPENDFHWGYYLHTGPTCGIKYHIRNLGSGWISDHGPRSGIFKSNFLCVLIQIGTVPNNRHGILDQTMKYFDERINSIPDVTCRVWLMKVLVELIQSGIVQCTDLNALEAECKQFGNQYRLEAASNIQPRPVVNSTRCS